MTWGAMSSNGLAGFSFYQQEQQWTALDTKKMLEDKLEIHMTIH